MRKLTATLCLTIAMLLGSAGVTESAEYTVLCPDGNTYTLDGPEGAPEQAINNYATQQWHAKQKSKSIAPIEGTCFVRTTEKSNPISSSKSYLDIQGAAGNAATAAGISTAIPAIIAFVFAWFVTKRKGRLFTVLGVTGGTLSGFFSAFICVFVVFDLPFSSKMNLLGTSFWVSLLASWWLPKLARKQLKKAQERKLKAAPLGEQSSIKEPIAANTVDSRAVENNLNSDQTNSELSRKSFSPALQRTLLLMHWLISIAFAFSWVSMFVAFTYGEAQGLEILQIALFIHDRTWDEAFLYCVPFAMWVFPVLFVGLQWIANGRLIYFPWQRQPITRSL